MRVLSTAALALVLVSGIASAQTGEREIDAARPPIVGEAPKITLAAKATAAPGQPFRIACQHNCRWFETEAPAGVVLIPRDWIGSTDLVGYASEGSYTILCRGSLNDVRTESRCQLLVTSAPPVPPTPLPPGPAPIPPPNPVPVPPAPTDPLTVDLRKLYAADTSPSKAADAAALAGVYRSGARILRDQPTAFPTLGDLFARLREASKFALSKADALEPIRNRLKDEHGKVFSGPPTTPIDDAMRARAVEYFGRVASAMEGLR